jgi:prepilin-type processing-associated H-X9-DG protein
LRLETSDHTFRTNGKAAQQGLKGLRGTLGPLRSRVLGTGKRTTSTIPLLGDAAPGDTDEAIAAVDFGYSPTDRFGIAAVGKKTYVQAGEVLARSVGEGPAYYDSSTKRIKRIGSYNSRLDAQLTKEQSGEPVTRPTGSAGNFLYLHATTQWFAMHGKNSLNLAMADGSVQSFTDTNGDGYLNPGFGVPTNLTDPEYESLGYRSSEIELPDALCFSGVFIAPNLVKGELDN